MRFVATTLFGLEGLTGEDIDALGLKRVFTGDGRVYFDGEPSDAPRALINLRYAERVLVEVGSFDCDSFDALFEGVKALDWASYIPLGAAFPVKGHSIKSKLFSITDCQRIIKKAVADSLMRGHGTASLPEDGIKYQIIFFILNDRASLMIDLCGAPLHKRGYRRLHNIAPMRETLSAAMVKLSRPRENVCIVDPMCGSGTIPIEAAMLARNIAPGLYRSFDSEMFGFIPSGSFEAAREEAKSRILDAAPMKIYGFDTDDECIRISRMNAAAAGVSGDIVFEKRDCTRFKLPYPDARGTIVTDPPYGRRLMDTDSSRQVISAFASAMAREAPRWQIYCMSTDETLQRQFGRKADKVRLMHNGTERCSLYMFYKNQK